MLVIPANQRGRSAAEAGAWPYPVEALARSLVLAGAGLDTLRAARDDAALSVGYGAEPFWAALSAEIKTSASGPLTRT